MTRRQFLSLSAALLALVTLPRLAVATTPPAGFGLLEFIDFDEPILGTRFLCDRLFVYTAYGIYTVVDYVVVENTTSHFYRGNRLWVHSLPTTRVYQIATRTPEGLEYWYRLRSPEA